VLTGRGTVSLSSFGGEGQGEEVVVLSQHARDMGAATRWKAAANRSIEKGEGPPLPSPLPLPKGEGWGEGKSDARTRHSLRIGSGVLPSHARQYGFALFIVGA
jgi:hypothetical protein